MKAKFYCLLVLLDGSAISSVKVLLNHIWNIYAHLWSSCYLKIHCYCIGSWAGWQWINCSTEKINLLIELKVSALSLETIQTFNLLKQDTADLVVKAFDDKVLFIVVKGAFKYAIYVMLSQLGKISSIFCDVSVYQKITEILVGIEAYALIHILQK